MFDYAKAVEWIAHAASDFFQYQETKTEHQSETEILNSRKLLKKTSKQSIELLFETIVLIYKYRKYMTIKDRLKFSRIIKKTKGIIYGR